MSYLGHKRPSSVTWTVSGTGAAIVSDTRLDNGRPADYTRIRFVSDDPPATTDYLAIRGTWATEITPKIGCLLGLGAISLEGSPEAYEAYDFPTGVKVEIYGKRAIDANYDYPLGGNALTQDVVKIHDQTKCCWWVFADDLEPIIGVEIRIYNDNGSEVTWANSTVHVDVGEIGIFEAIEIGVKPGYSWRWVDPTERKRTLGSQSHRVARRPYRAGEFEIAPAPHAEAFGATITSESDWQTAAWNLSRDNACAMVLRPTDYAGVLDEIALHRESVFGECSRVGDLSHAGVRHFGHRYTIEEVPARSTV